MRDCAEPQAPALPTLLLAVSPPLVLLDQQRACIAIPPITPINQLLNQKPICTFSTGPFLCRHPIDVTGFEMTVGNPSISKLISEIKTPSNVARGASSLSK